MVRWNRQGSRLLSSFALFCGRCMQPPLHEQLLEGATRKRHCGSQLPSEPALKLQVDGFVQQGSVVWRLPQKPEKRLLLFLFPGAICCMYTITFALFCGLLAPFPHAQVQLMRPLVCDISPVSRLHISKLDMCDLI